MSNAIDTDSEEYSTDEQPLNQKAQALLEEAEEAAVDTSTEEQSIPAEMKTHEQWVCEENKRPQVPDGSGKFASTNDSTTWGEFDQAVEASQQQKGVGIGFVLTEEDPYLVIDFDEVRDPETGETEQWVRDAVDQWDSFTEVSPSGTGLHVWLKDVTEPEWWTDTDHIEVYESGQYLTVTGDPYPGTPLTCATPPDFEDWLKGHAGEETLLSGESHRVPQEYEEEFDLDVYDVLSRSSYPEGKRRSHPFHGSSTKANFKVFDGGETWYCFRHDCGGNVLHLIGMDEDVIKCGEWKHGGLTDKQWAKLFEAGRKAGYNLPRPSGSGRQEPQSLTEAILEDPEQWLDPDEQTITVHSVGDLTASEVKEQFEEQSLSESDALDLMTELDGDYGFSEFWKDSSAWTIRTVSPDDKWRQVRGLYSEKGGRDFARSKAVDFLRDEFDFATVRDNEQMYCYDPETGIYGGEARQAVNQRLEEMLGMYYSSTEVREIVARLEASSYIDRSEFGQSGPQVCVGNGVVDIETGEMSEFNPNYYFQSRLPVEYDPDAECPRFEEFLDDVCPDDKIPQLQEFLGYCLQPRMDHKKALLLLGPTDAGKSVFLDGIEALFGDDSKTALSVQYLANERWGEAELVGKMVNIRHDLDSTDIKNAGKIKELTAGNQVRAERKNQHPFMFSPRTKHIFAANQPPSRSSEDDGFWNRWLTVVFPERIPRSEQDSRLTEKLTTDEELSGILNWAIEGYQRLGKQGHFTNEPKPRDNQRMWEQYGNSVERFISRRLSREPAGVVRQDEAYAAYEEFAKGQSMEVATKHKFTSTLKEKDASTKQRRFDGERKRVYTGYTLMD